MASKQHRIKGPKQKHRRSSGASPNAAASVETKISLYRRIDPIYLEEEAKVKELVEPRKYELDEPTQSDLEVLFFTNGLPKDEESGSESSFKSVYSNDLQDTQQANYLDTIVKIEEDMLFDRIKKQIKYDPNLLYFPSSERPSIPNMGSSTTMPSLASQGIHEAPIPKLNQKNKNLLYNRLLEEDKYHLFNQNAELIGLSDHIRNREQLFKYESVREFPVKFILVHVEDESNVQTKLEESKVLLLKIDHLKFHHHHLFSEEAFLANSILKNYNEYSEAKKAGGPERFLQRIDILKQSIDDDINQESSQYKNVLMEILEQRNKFHLESKLQKDRSQTILEEYKSLKALRKTQNFNSTSLKLIITMDNSKTKQRPKILEDLLEEEIQETFSLQNLEYLEAKKTRKQRRKSSSPEEIENLPPLPQKPSLDSIKTALRKKFKECHFDINHFHVDFLLKRIPTRPCENNPLEQKRQLSVSSAKVLLKVFCNNEPIGVINQIQFSEDFEVSFYSSIAIRLTGKLPDQLRIDVIEERALKPKIKLSKLFVPVPRSDDSGNIETDASQLEFISQKSIQSDLGIGSGQFCIRKNQQQFINGYLSLKIGWKDSGPKASTIPQTVSTSLQKIHQHQRQHDPMNPDIDRDTAHSGNEESNEEDAQVNDYKQFFFLEDELTFCSEQEMKNNQRFKILRERSKKNKKYKDFKLVPTTDRHMEDYEASGRIIDETLGMDSIDLQRFRGKQYLIEVYSTISNYCKSLNEEFNENSLLLENMPTLASMVSAFFSLFGPNRPLKPTRKRQDSHRPSYRNVDVKQFNVSLNIVRAFGIPPRHDDAQLSTRKSSNMSSPNTNGYRPANIRPFITATFKDSSARTSTGDGSNPTWNEQLTLPLSLRNWNDMKGCLSIQLYDEYVDDIMDDDRNRLTDIYQRISSKFIGELRIPLTDLYFSQRIEGTFEMSSPPLIGYTKASIRTPQSQSAPTSTFTTNNIIPDLKGPIYVSLLVNLEPYFEHDYFTTKHLECTETDQLKTTVGMWMYDYQLEFPHRQMDPYVTLLNGKRTFIMNLLGPINLPFSDTTEKDKLEAQLRRYVALIPTLSSIDPCVQRSGVWLLNHQVFNTLRCSQKDLAVILTNFYLEMGLEAWLMIGESQLRKNSGFVLLKESQTEYFIVDPVTGRKYQSTDTYCPLTSIHFLVNDQNIFGNIQVETKVFMTRFDVKDGSDWRPMFKKSQEFTRGFLQEQNYPFKTSYDIRNIHSIIEAKLTKKISQWRGHRKTVWNRIVRDNLRRILIELEKDTTEYSDNGDHLEKLNFLNNNFRVSGCPLNMSYINLSHVVERVKSIGIHLSTDPRVEFGLSVYVHPYPNYIISVWVFLIALLPK